MRGSWLERGRLVHTGQRDLGLSRSLPYGTDDVMKPGPAGEWSWY